MFCKSITKTKHLFYKFNHYNLWDFFKTFLGGELSKQDLIPDKKTEEQGEKERTGKFMEDNPEEIILINLA